MYTCIRCLGLLVVDSSVDDEAVIVCPECGFHVTAGDMRFFEQVLGAPSTVCPTCLGTGRVSIPTNESLPCTILPPLPSDYINAPS